MAKDLSKQTYFGLADETVQTVQKCFDKYDLNRDCRLSRSEFKCVLVACGLRDVDATAIYNKVDANNDQAVDMREFIKWLYADNIEMDTDKPDEAQERMGKIKKHVQRGVMTKEEAQDDFFEFMTSLKDEYKYASKRDVVVLDKNLKETVKKSGARVTEASREVKLKDFFRSMDLNGNGKLTMSEFVGGIKSFGHCGDQEMIADIFRAIDQEKSKTRVIDKRYNELKKKEDDAAAQGTTSYLVPACEVFEKRDMSKWNEDRAEAINEAMASEKDGLQELLSERTVKEDEKIDKIVEKRRLQDKIDAKKVANPSEDRADFDMVRDLDREITEIDNAIRKQTAILNEPRFVYTTTKHKDGLLDYKEFLKFFDAHGGM